MDKVKLKFSLRPTQVLVFGFLFIILCGGLLLFLPVSSADGSFTPILDCMFTSASAVCVTGLTTVNTAAHWSPFGKVVIMLLIQVGGLGFITLMTSVLLLAGRRITLRERLLIQESLNLSKKHGIVRFVKFLARFALAIELGGAVLLALRFIPDYGFPRALWMGLFHSVSAFCNAGFDIIGASSLTPYAEDFVVNTVIMLLIITGGLGFPVWVELIGLVRKDSKFTFKQKIRRLSLHTKLALITSGVLIVSGAVITFILEYGNPQTLGSCSLYGKIMLSLFHSVVLRTAGFFTMDYGAITPPTKFISVILMMIGGSPCGTAGGVKTISAAVILLAVISLIKDKDSIYAFGRSIPFKLLQKALTVTIMMLALLVLSTALLSITEAQMCISHGYEFLDLMFEAASALGTVGSTIGLTSLLSVPGKIIIIICMFIGRLGPITIAISFLTSKSDRDKVRYPAEDILVG